MYLLSYKILYINIIKYLFELLVSIKVNYLIIFQ